MRFSAPGGSRRQLFSALCRVEDLFLVCLLGAMLVVATLQIFLRNIFGTSLFWGDPLTQKLVLWAGFMGASVATREASNIVIDVLARPLPPRAKAWVGAVTDFFSAVVCACLLYASISYLHFEYMEKSTTLWDLPGWTLLLVFPISFGLMTLRFTASGFKRFSRGKESDGA
jgi:TRAP-type C4-dicarboxylate transport system permease small subunit